MTEKQQEQLKEKIVRAIKTVYDPEIPVDAVSYTHLRAHETS